MDYPQHQLCASKYGKDFWDSLSDERKKNFLEAEKFLDYEHCVRLYNSKGEHVLSILRCLTGGFDVSTPDGKVVWADCDGENWELWEMIATHLGVKKIQNDK